MQKYSAIIIDDETPAIEMLTGMLRNFPEIHLIKSFTDAKAALEFLLEPTCIDIIFLDVEMPNMNGFEFLKELQNYPISPCIIFTTGFEKFAIEAMRAAAFAFLLKPVQQDDLEKALQRYKIQSLHDQFKQKSQILFQKIAPPRKLVLAHYRGFVAYQPDEILYIEADRNYSYLHLTNGNKQIVSLQLGQIEKAIPNSHFFRINRSTIINLTWFTHADQKLKKCFLEVDAKEYDFPIKVSKIRELQGVMMGE
jgi:two-component system LytT family response regulator